MLSLGLWVVSWVEHQHADLRTLTVGMLLALPVNDTDAPAFPISDKAHKVDKHLTHICEYLTTLQRPDNIDNASLACLLAVAKRFFLANGQLWRRQVQGCHQLYAPHSQCMALISDTHDNLGHKGFYLTRRTLVDRFWWPSLEQDARWFINTCHQCQLRQTTKIRIPPMVSLPAPLFQKLYVDTMLMPRVGGFCYITQAHCSLTTWPEWHALCAENGRTLGAFLFEEVLCHWGAVEEIVSNNSTPYITALDWLADRYGIRHIRISAYNSCANSVIEWQHRTICKSLVKACNGDPSKWPARAPYVFWANVTLLRVEYGQTLAKGFDY